MPGTRVPYAALGPASKAGILAAKAPADGSPFTCGKPPPCWYGPCCSMTPSPTGAGAGGAGPAPAGHTVTRPAAHTGRAASVAFLK